MGPAIPVGGRGHERKQATQTSETAALRARLSRLSEASQRINESLDLHTVLQEIVDSARDPTHAQYGVITTYVCNEPSCCWSSCSQYLRQGRP